MTEKHITKNELIQLLGEAIDAELEKPTEETDMDFVTECEHMINALMGNEHVYTDEDAEKYFAEIKKKEKAKKNTFSIRSKKVLAASIAVFIIFIGGFTVYAASPVVRDFIHSALNLDIGQFVEEDGITYINSGTNIKYENIEELIENEKLDIKYPKYIPYNATIKKISYIEEDKNVYFTFSDDRIQFTIKKNSYLSDSFIKNAQKTTIGNWEFYITSKNIGFMSCVIISDDLYTLQCDSEDELIKMINSIE